MASSTFNHWSRPCRGRLVGGLLIALGLGGLLIASILLGRLGGRCFAVGLIPIGIGAVLLVHSHWAERASWRRSPKRT
jgi:hypothetical protein